MYARFVRGFVRRGLSTKAGLAGPMNPSAQSPVGVPASLVPADRASEAVRVRPPAPPSRKGPPPLAKVEAPFELADADLQSDDDEDIEELEDALLLSASEPPPASEQLVDPDDVVDAPASERLLAASHLEVSTRKPTSEAPPTVKAEVPTREPKLEDAPKIEDALFSPPAPKVASPFQTIPPPADYDRIRVATGSKLAFQVAEKKPSERPSGAAKASGTLMGIGPKENAEARVDAPVLDRVPVIDPSVFRADAIASASPRERAKTAPIAMPRKGDKTSASQAEIEPEAPRGAGSAKVMVVLAAVLVLGAGLTLLGLSAKDEPTKPRTVTTTNVPPVVNEAPSATAIATAKVVETIDAPAAPSASAIVTAPATPATPPPVVATATVAPPPVGPPRTTTAAAPAASSKTPTPRGTAPPPGLEFLKTDL